MQRREETRREEEARRNLEVALQAFDAYSFYAALENWANTAVPQPVSHTIHLTPLRQKVIMRQPLPLSRKELYDLRHLSSDCGRLLYLLRAIDQRGMECPYVHQQHRLCLEKAIEKCDQIKNAGEEYLKGQGFWARFVQLLNRAHLEVMKKDIDFFKGRLEAVLIMCRHEEFAQDLLHLRRAVTYRTGQLLNQSEQKPPSRPRPGVPSRPGVRRG